MICRVKRKGIKGINTHRLLRKLLLVYKNKFWGETAKNGI